MVPEVSLVLDKPDQITKQSTDFLPNTVLESRILRSDTSQQQAKDTYTAWKEKRCPSRPSTNAQSPIPQIYSSTQNSSALQDNNCNYSLRQPFKSSQMESRNQIFHQYNLDDQFQRNNVYSHGSEFIENSNKLCPMNYFPSNNSNNNYSNNHTSSSNNFASRSPNEDNRTNLYGNRWSEDKIWSNEKRITDEKKIYKTTQSVDAYDFIHKLRQQRSSMCPNLNSYSPKADNDHTFNNKQSIQSVQNIVQDHCHHQSTCCTTNHSNLGGGGGQSAETETVRNLLQVITSQNQQIKSLQKQLDRMIKLHEQNLKNKNHCTCQTTTVNHDEIIYHNSHVYDKSRNSNLPVAQKNMTRDRDRSGSEIKSQDDNNKQTVLEQKVSIGVMTSFELKVQNNPSTDNENKKKNPQDNIRKPSTEKTSNMVKNLVNDTEEMIKRKNNFFTHTPLENISEGSESHVSSFRQNCLTPAADVHDLPVDARCYKDDFVNEKNPLVNGDSNNVREFTSGNSNVDSNFVERNENIFGQNNVEKMQFLKNMHDLPEENFQIENNSTVSDTEPLANDLAQIELNNNYENFEDECSSLSESDIEIETSVLSPEPSIHLDMQEFSSECGSLPPQNPNENGSLSSQQATANEWIMVQNVFDQVNKIFQNSSQHENYNEESPNGYYEKKNSEYDVIIDSIRAATIEHLSKRGICLADQRKSNGNKM